MANCHSNILIDYNKNNSNNNELNENSQDSENLPETNYNELDVPLIREPSLCKCTNTRCHVEIKFSDKTTRVCLNNKDDRCVVNLSSHNLSEDEISLLLKGLTFCPTPGEPLIKEIKEDLKAFFRRLKLKAHYHEDDPTPNPNPSQLTLDSFLLNTGPTSQDDDVNVSKFKLKSTWEPDQHQVDPAIETFCRAVLKEVSYFNPTTPRTKNVSEPENDALKQLEDNYAITIKKADKGSAVVVMDTVDYINEAHRQLSDTNFYVKLGENRTELFSARIRELLLDLTEMGEIDKKVYEALAPSNCRTPKFYFLPKIHKKTVVGRPIISGNGCPTEQISAFVDEHIKPYVSTFPSYVKDTTDFIAKLRSLKTTKKIFLVTMDVTSLYTNIPNQEGKTAVHRTLLENNYDGKLSLDGIMTLLHCVLHMNNFEFNDEQYLQVGGTAMGTILAPSYANTFLGQLEKKLLAHAPCKPDLYLRYIDDIFCVFTTCIQDIENFIEYMNSSHRTIKFTAEISEEEINFLDTTVKVDKSTNEIYTDLYTKDTDTQNYLSFDSCHPQHCKTGGPYGEFLRIRRNCSRIEDYEKHSANRVKDYERRGYPTPMLEEARDKARKMDRDQLLIPKEKKRSKKQNRVPLIVTYNPSNPNFYKILQKH